MIIAVDAGNTNIVLGAVEGTRVLKLCRMETNRQKTEYEYAVAMKGLLELMDLSPRDFEGAALCSVVPPITHTLAKAMEIVTGQAPLIVGSGVKTGLNILIDNPAQLGSDLVAGAVGAAQDYPLPLIIIDMGTATTVSVIDSKGRFRGGIIAPGVNTAMNALSSGTSQLPRVAIEAPRHCIGTNTVESMQSAAVFGNAAMIDGLIDRILEELGEEATLVATGGIAGAIIPHCRHRILLDPELLLKGLALIFERNKKQ